MCSWQFTGTSPIHVWMNIANINKWSTIKKNHKSLYTFRVKLVKLSTEQKAADVFQEAAWHGRLVSFDREKRVFLFIENIASCFCIYLMSTTPLISWVETKFFLKEFWILSHSDLNFLANVSNCHLCKVIRNLFRRIQCH